MLNLRKFTTVTSVAVLGVLFASETFAADVTWNVSVWGKRRAFTEHIEYLAEKVAEKTGGKFKLNIAYGGSLSKPKENLDGISIGAFEMAQICAGYHADKNPTLTVLELPFLGVKDLDEEVKVSEAVYQHPAVKKDLARWNAQVLMPSPMPQYNVLGAGDPPLKIADFEGMRVRATGGIGKAMETVGAVPTSVTASEAYQAMDSGTVRAVAFAPHAHLAFKTVEAGNWWTSNLNPGTVQCPVVVNKDAYAALPEDLRKTLDETVPEAVDHYLATYAKVYDKWWPELKKRNIQQIKYSADDLAAFKAKAGQPIWDQWVAEQSAKGIPAQELLDLVLSNIQ